MSFKIMTTDKEENKFLKMLFETDEPFKCVLEHVNSEVRIDDVYSKQQIIDAACNFDPDEVFDTDALAGWAEDNEYTKD